MTKQEGRPFDENELLNQIGRRNLMAISGDRVRVIRNSELDTVEIWLPVSSGYGVSVSLGWDDTYTVAREFVRAGKVSDKGTIEGVYCDEVGEVAYQASCFRSNYEFGKVVSK